MLAGFPDSVSSDELAALELDVRGAIERLRSMLFELRPAALDIEGLVPALEQYLEHVATSTGWLWEVQGHVVEEPDTDVRALLYRIAQEAIQNARKHAGATQLRVDVATAGDGVSVRIHDDGAGFDPDEASRPEPGHLGMSAMLESAELAGGWVRVASSFGEGTTVECWLPLDATAESVSEDA
jgi:signal transduction histidine kinase